MQPRPGHLGPRPVHARGHARRQSRVGLHPSAHRRRVVPAMGRSGGGAHLVRGEGRVAARRDWEMRCTSDGGDGRASTPVGKATSQWIAFNLEKRKLARIPQSVIDQFESQALKGCA